MFNKQIEIFERIDESILRMCTRFSHWLQRNFGLTNFFVVKVGAFLSGLSIILSIVNYWWPILKDPTNILFLFANLLLFVYVVLYVHVCNLNEQRLHEGKTLLPLVGGNQLSFRIMLLIFLCDELIAVLLIKVSIIDFIHLRFFVPGQFIIFYFSLVTPLPPGMSRLRKFIENFSGFGRKPAEVTSS